MIGKNTCIGVYSAMIFNIRNFKICTCKISKHFAERLPIWHPQVKCTKESECDIKIGCLCRKFKACHNFISLSSLGVFMIPLRQVSYLSHCCTYLAYLMSINFDYTFLSVLKNHTFLKFLV